MTDDMQVAAAAAAFGTLIFFGGLAAWLRRFQQSQRLRRYVAIHSSAASPGGPISAKKAVEASGIVVGLNRRLGHTSMAQQLELDLVRAGLVLTPNHFILAQIALASTLYLVGQFLLFGGQGALTVLLSLGLAAPALILPRFLLKYLQGRRITRFESQLAQAVDIMAGALQAGSSLPQAFEMVSREMPNPIGEEFGRLIQETKLGIPLDQSLENMVERVPSMDLEMLVTAINIQYRVGGNLSHILKTIAHTIRERVRIRGELNTLTAQARLSSYIIAIMPVVVVVALLFISPDYIKKLFEPGVTRVMLITGILGIMAGFYVMKRIATIEV